MPFPLTAVLAAAPSVISAAADIIRVIRERKNIEPAAPQVDSQKLDEQKLDEMADLIERQAKVIEELALNNSNLALAVRNNRLLSVISMAIGLSAVFLSLLL